MRGAVATLLVASAFALQVTSPPDGAVVFLERGDRDGTSLEITFGGCGGCDALCRTDGATVTELSSGAPLIWSRVRASRVRSSQPPL